RQQGAAGCATPPWLSGQSGFRRCFRRYNKAIGWQARRSDVMALIGVVLVADVFRDLIAGHEASAADCRERFRVGAGVIYGDLDADVAQIGSRVALDSVELFGMRMAEVIEPEFV